MERLDAIVRDPLFKECLEKNREAEQKREFCQHGRQHLVDVARITYILVLESGYFSNLISENHLQGATAAREVVYAAGLLHDIGRWKQYQTGQDHAALGAELATGILERAGFTPAESRIIKGAIYQHGGDSDQMNKLGELLHRADNLARSCHDCTAQERCYKFATMETGKLALIY